MSRKMVTERVGYFDDYELFTGSSFDEVIDMLVDQRDLYAEKYKHALKIYFSSEYSSDGSEYIQIMIDRLETDKEMEKRLEQERKAKEKRKLAKHRKEEKIKEELSANEKLEKEVLKQLIEKYGVPDEN
jgi:hypothetical protein